jgi:hypothetical protein
MTTTLEETTGYGLAVGAHPLRLKLLSGHMVARCDSCGAHMIVPQRTLGRLYCPPCVDYFGVDHWLFTGVKP